VSSLLHRHHVLVAAVDLSPASAAVFDEALEVAHDAPDAHIHLVHVASAKRGVVRADAVDALAAWAERLPPHASEIHLHALEGSDPAAEIVGFAKRIGADVILVGTHGRSGVARVFQGSVAETIVRTASCSVFVVKPKQHGEG
jgi:nucleotide-binding universal stress UspA family protein